MPPSRSIWDLEPKDLAGEPHVRTIAAACADKFGDGAMWERLIQSHRLGRGDAARHGRDRAHRPHHPVAGAVAAARRRDAGHLRRRHRPLPHRKRAARPQRGAGSGRPAEIRFHQACLLRTAHAAQHHPGFCRTSGERACPGPLNQRQTRICAGHRLGLEHAEEPGQRHSRSRADRIRRAAAGAGAHRSVSRCWPMSRPMRANGRRRWASAWRSIARPMPGMFLADARRIRQVVFNLLSNAFKYTPRGGAIVLGGADRGRGCADLGRRQRAGHRAGSEAPMCSSASRPRANAGQRAGAGLGLALVNRFVELHDGWVEIESKPTAPRGARWCAATCRAASTANRRRRVAKRRRRRRWHLRGRRKINAGFSAYAPRGRRVRRSPRSGRRAGCSVPRPARNRAWFLPSPIWAAVSSSHAWST